MLDSPIDDEPISKRRSQRSCRLSIPKPQPVIIQEEVEPIVDENEIEDEDPIDQYQLGDIFWVRIQGNPWWPALIYGSYYEDNIHTRIIKTNHRRKRRRYFVYFFGPDFEYSWTDAHTIIPYSGLEEFIKHAEISVQNATTKTEQIALANRFELKVAASKRSNWEKAIKEADESLKLTREQRLENFSELLKTILQKSKEKKRSSTTTRQSRKSSSSSSSTDKSSVKRQKTTRKPVSTSTTLLHVGLPTLTKAEEKLIVTGLLEYPDNDQLTFKEALSYVCQLVMEKMKENFQYDMTCIQIEWFYDFLLNYPEIVSKYSHWFNDDIKMTNLVDKLKRKQYEEEEVLESSIFDILENDFQIGDIVWAKLNGISWWPAFVYGCFSDNWKYVKFSTKPGSLMKKQYFVYSFGPHPKYIWVHQASLCRYKGLDEFVNYSENQAEQATTRRTEEQLLNRYKVRMSKELHPLWKEAVKEADEILTLSISSRINALEKIVRQLLVGTKYKISQQGQIISSDTLMNEEQQGQSEGKTQTLSALCNIPKRILTNKRFEVSSEMIEKSKRTFSFNSTRKESNEIDQSSKTQDNDITILKTNTSFQSSTVSLTTAICHFLDKGIPWLTIYEEICLVNELINHQLGSLLTLTDAQLYFEQYVINIASMNYNHRMSFVQSDYFYDFLLKYPQIILKYHQWFKDFKQTLMPINSDKIQLKKWQLATLLHAHMNLEQRFH